MSEITDSRKRFLFIRKNSIARGSYAHSYERSAHRLRLKVNIDMHKKTCPDGLEMENNAIVSMVAETTPEREKKLRRRVNFNREEDRN